jgi:hypothetical protein
MAGPRKMAGRRSSNVRRSLRLHVCNETQPDVLACAGPTRRTLESLGQPLDFSQCSLHEHFVARAVADRPFGWRHAMRPRWRFSDVIGTVAS